MATETGLKSSSENKGKLAASQAASPSTPSLFGLSQDKSKVKAKPVHKEAAPRKAAPKKTAPKVAPTKSVVTAISSVAPKRKQKKVALAVRTAPATSRNKFRETGAAQGGGELTEYDKGVFNYAGWRLCQVPKPTFKMCAGKHDSVAVDSKTTNSYLCPNPASDDCQFFVVDMRSANKQITDKICDFLCLELNEVSKSKILKVAMSCDLLHLVLVRLPTRGQP